MIFRYVAAAATLEEIERWCAERGLVPGFLERGPDGLIRGTCREEGRPPPAASDTPTA